MTNESKRLILALESRLDAYESHKPKVPLSHRLAMAAVMIVWPREVRRAAASKFREFIEESQSEIEGELK